MSYLVVSSLSAGFPDKSVVTGLSLAVEAGETLAILGRSGCGKTTLLKTLAGLHPIQGGSVRLGGQEVGKTPPQDRGILYLSQEPLLFPHLNVFDNIAFGCRLRRMPFEVMRAGVLDMLDQLGLKGMDQQKPEHLSGGQRQRVAFGRALIVKPPVLLLDEPFGNLDADTRTEMQALFRNMVQRHRMTSLFVTHDLKEAMLMGDRQGFMDEGQLTVYADLDDFCADARTGVSRELDFWKKLF